MKWSGHMYRIGINEEHQKDVMFATRAHVAATASRQYLAWRGLSALAAIRPFTASATPAPRHALPDLDPPRKARPPHRRQRRCPLCRMN